MVEKDEIQEIEISPDAAFVGEAINNLAEAIRELAQTQLFDADEPIDVDLSGNNIVR